MKTQPKTQPKPKTKTKAQPKPKTQPKTQPKIKAVQPGQLEPIQTVKTFRLGKGLGDRIDQYLKANPNMKILSMVVSAGEVVAVIEPRVPDTTGQKKVDPFDPSPIKQKQVDPFDPDPSDPDPSGTILRRALKDLLPPPAIWEGKKLSGCVRFRPQHISIPQGSTIYMPCPVHGRHPVRG